MPRPFRTAVALVGLCAAVYSTASLTGGWLGTPPWWWEVGPPTSFRAGNVMQHFTDYRARPGRELISASIAAVGLALFAWAAWPGRPRARTHGA